ncbi:MAG: LamG domain-containing protein [Planctomycetota bacterium]
MCRKLIYSVSFILMLGLALPSAADVADPNLVGCWRFDGNALDSSGNERHGTLRGNPQFVTGVYNEALELDGDDYVTIDGYKGVLGTNPWSVAFWIKTTNGDNRAIICWGSTGGGNRSELRILDDILRWNTGNGNIEANTSPTDGEWHHIAVTLVDGTAISSDGIRIYVDGEDDTITSSDTSSWGIVAGEDFSIGLRVTHSDRYFIGSIDDVLIYGKVLTPQEIKLIMRDASNLAWEPNPPNQATVSVDRAKQLTWLPGDKASMHDVYFGTDLDAVTNASVAAPLGVYQGRQNHSYYPAIGNLNLEFGQTYFWRIDEVNDANLDNPYKGEIWKFEVEEYLRVDDFDSYVDTNDLLLTWVDGSDNGTGSTISLETEFAGNSMNYVYDNTSYPWYSEVERTYTTPQDLTAGGAKALELRFRGDANNSPEQMYLALEDTAGNRSLVIQGNPNALVQEQWQGWQNWAIALQDFVNVNDVNLAKIKKVTIGIGNGIDPSPLTSKGNLHIDDILLHPPRCFPEYVATSFNDDCTTDLADLYVIAQHWLVSDYNVVAVEPRKDRLQVYYKFDETSGAVVNDSSVKGYHATVDANGANAWDPCGYDGGCLDFDGTFTVSVPNDVFSNIYSEVTVSVWVYLDVNVNPNAVDRVEFSAGPMEPNQPWDRLAWTQQEPEHHIGQWNHYAFVKDANYAVMRIYHNGLLVAQNTDAFLPIDGIDAGQSTIGSKSDGDSSYYQGKLDDFRIYDYSLSHAEVLYLATGSVSELYQPLQPVLSPVDPDEDGKITFRDFASVAEWWLRESLWP